MCKNLLNLKKLLKNLKNCIFYYYFKKSLLYRRKNFFMIFINIVRFISLEI